MVLKEPKPPGDTLRSLAASQSKFGDTASFSFFSFIRCGDSTTTKSSCALMQCSSDYNTGIPDDYVIHPKILLALDSLLFTSRPTVTNLLQVQLELEHHRDLHLPSVIAIMLIKIIMQLLHRETYNTISSCHSSRSRHSSHVDI